MKKKVMLLLYILIFQILSINQEQIAFAEIANVQTEEQRDNNTSNETGYLLNPQLYNFSRPIIETIRPYDIIIGDDFRVDYPFISAKDEDGNDVDFSRLKYIWKYTEPIKPNIIGHTATLEYRYYGDRMFTSIEVPIRVVDKDGRKALVKHSTYLYVGQKWDLGSAVEIALDKDGNPINLEQLNDVWIDKKKEEK